MSIKSAPKGRSLPQNPHYLVFERSDGDEANWPKNTTRVVDQEGHVNYMRPIPLNESSCIGWRCGIGAALAKHMNLPELAEGHDYILKDWPAGYQMYDHNKGPHERPRHDPYLVGSKHTARFRSTPEFVPHALWLMTDPTMDRANCTCKYCSRTPQRAISQGMGLLGTRTSTPSSQPRMSVSLGKPPQAAKPRPVRVRPDPPEAPYTAVRKKPLAHPAPRPLPGPKEAILPERVNDIRAAYRPNARYFREDELVWCGLEQPIGEIRFWPALVQEIRLKTRAIANDTEGWSVAQSNMYKLQLLAIDTVMLMPGDVVLPYVAYAPGDDLLHALLDASSRAEIHPQRISKFDPAGPAQFAEASVAYSLAVQIGANIARSWCGTDDYRAKLPRAGAGPSGLNATVTQTRFQGLWWGAERVWVDDFVRLRCDRAQIAAGEHVLPAAEPSASVLARLRADPALGAAEDLRRYGAGSRGVFMRLDGICLREVPEDGKARRECRLHGPLYELVDEDWVEPPAADAKSAPGWAQPVSAAAASVLMKSLANMAPQKKPARPILTQHPAIPPPPVGYRFRPILTGGQEAVVSVALMGGRYYPGIQVEHRTVREMFTAVMAAEDEAAMKVLAALAGLTSGVHGSSEPALAQETREAIYRRADEDGRHELFKLWDSRGAEIIKEEVEDIEMMDG